MSRLLEKVKRAVSSEEQYWRLAMEIWKDVAGYEGYKVSNLGNLKSTGRYGADGRFIKPKTIKPSTDRYGYLYVHMSNLLGSKKLKVHRLVCIAFHGYSELTVDHKDEVKSNNRASNLQWMDSGDNSFKSSAKAIKVVDPDGVPCEFVGIAKFCREFGVDRSGLTQVLAGRQKHTGGWTLHENS